MKLKNPRSGGNGEIVTKTLLGVRNSLNRFFQFPDKIVYDPSNGIIPDIKLAGVSVYVGGPEHKVKRIYESGGAVWLEMYRPPPRNQSLIATYVKDS